jgi:hypothetical protein
MGMNLGDCSIPHLFLGIGGMGDCVRGVGVDGGHTRDFALLNTMLGYDAAGERSLRLTLLLRALKSVRKSLLSSE